MAYIITFILGFILSFMGTLMPGPINLNVGETAIRKNMKAAWTVSYGASFIEIFQATGAMFIGRALANKVSDNVYTRLFVIAAFVAIGLFFYFKKVKQADPNKEYKRSATDFGKGILLALINPQAIPYWVVAFAALDAKNWVDFTNLSIVVVFIAGITLGKLLSLMVYAYLGVKITEKIERIRPLINRIIGSTLLIVAGIQTIVLIYRQFRA